MYCSAVCLRLLSLLLMGTNADSYHVPGVVALLQHFGAKNVEVEQDMFGQPRCISFE